MQEKKFYIEIIRQLKSLLNKRGNDNSRYNFIINCSCVDIYKCGVKVSSINLNKFTYNDIINQEKKWVLIKTKALNTANLKILPNDNKNNNTAVEDIDDLEDIDSYTCSSDSGECCEVSSLDTCD